MNEQSIRTALKYLGVYKPNSSYVLGDYLMHPCPFASVKHSKGSDYNPSFGIYISDSGPSYYNCFSCHEAGSLERLPGRYRYIINGTMEGTKDAVLYFRKLENETVVSLDEYGNFIETKKVYDPPEPINEAIYGNFYDSVFRSRLAVDYLKSRNISKKAIEMAKIQYDREQCRIVFPVRGADKNLYGFTGRTVIENWKDYHNPPHQLYPKVKDYYGLQKRFFLLGEDNIVQGKPTFVVEGLFGYLYLLSIEGDKFFNIVALMGSVMTPEKAKKLIDSGTSVFLMLDNDKAGVSGTESAIQQLYEQVPIYIPEWPEGKKDPDELTLQELENFRKMSYPYIKVNKKPYEWKIKS